MKSQRRRTPVKTKAVSATTYRPGVPERVGRRRVSGQIVLY